MNGGGGGGTPSKGAILEDYKDFLSNLLQTIYSSSWLKPQGKVITGIVYWCNPWNPWYIIPFGVWCLGRENNKYINIAHFSNLCIWFLFSKCNCTQFSCSVDICTKRWDHTSWPFCHFWLFPNLWERQIHRWKLLMRAVEITQDACGVMLCIYNTVSSCISQLFPYRIYLSRVSLPNNQLSSLSFVKCSTKPFFNSREPVVLNTKGLFHVLLRVNRLVCL